MHIQGLLLSRTLNILIFYKLLNVWLFSNYLNILFHNMIVMCNYTYFLEINLFLKHFSQSRMSLTSHD
ncbi:hypothetical protein JHK82_024234 [Glycine max]|uniref:Uncharacterized protein n=2 Tax=Glycine subgen. Soja TaxID=1462606 RepID=A0A0R0I4V3_SOYBN|nr:hypothetical protein JHK87_024197 [Glycine soja]KAG5006263.1 hypothetical protein JHK85_024805 [Glycine max]KAG5012061.1 hypothetical protein JHK86_024322 [Glycine max]KAG5133046.1 hypothetical protein JHK82_024234 [Glycine max]KAH1041865.1 hypothetical protein GYH30_024277 [Glycine max]